MLKSLNDSLCQTIFENTGTATVIIEVDTIISLVNMEFVKLSGYSKEEIENKLSWVNFVHPDDLERMHLYHQQRRGINTDPQQQLNIPRNYQFRFITRSKEVRLIVLTAAIIPQTSQSIASLRDITELHTKKLELDLSEKNFRLIFEELPQGLLIADPQTLRLVTGNEHICKMLNIPKSELSKYTVNDLHPANEIAKIKELFFRLLNNEITTATNVPLKVINSDKYIFADIRAMRIILGGEQCLVGIFSDISERKAIEDAVRESEEKYRTVIELSPEPIFVLDLNLNINIVNKKALELLKIKNESELLGQDITQFLINANYEQNKKLLITQGSLYLNDYEIKLKDGSKFYADVSATILRNDTGVYGIMTIIRDITAQKKAQQRLEQQEQEKSLLLDIISHDLVNYITTAEGYIRLALPQIHAPEAMDLIIKARAGILRANTLLNNATILLKHKLSYSYKLENVNLATAIKKARENLNILFPMKKVELNANCPGLEVFIQADALFDQLILNLLSNAVKYDNHDIKVIDITCEPQENQRYLLRVTDHGIGINPTQREEIFNRYVEFRKNAKGSGLGLFIVKTLVERYHGEIHISNRVLEDYSQGTTIEILLNKGI